MQCPRTGKPMEEVEIGGVKVDISTGCGGVWFDNQEINKFDETHESAGEDLISQMEKHKNGDVDESQRLNCPRCPDITMQRHYFSIKQHVEIDECAQCGGIWLDAGELLSIRGQYDTEEERNKAAEAFFSEMFNSPEIKAMKEKSEEDLKKARRFANAFKFICPTYYIPGKQDWGAF